MKRSVPISSSTQSSYERLFTLAREKNIEMSWSSLKFFQEEKFTHRVIFDGKIWKKIWNQPIRPDFIFDKSLFRYETVEIKEQMAAVASYLNPISLLIITNDKMLTYLSFPDVVVPTYRVTARRHMNIALKKIRSESIVLKPTRGSGGKGVRILTREKARRAHIKEPYVVQPFIDSSRGIPGVHSGIHDLRLLLLGNKIFHAYIRTSAPGSMLCNVSQGGRQFGIPLSQVPEDVKKIAKKFQIAFSQFRNTFYSVDFIYGKNGPKVIELNSMPGLADVPGYTKDLHFVHARLLKHIESFL